MKETATQAGTDARPAIIREVVIRDGRVLVYGSRICSKVREYCMSAPDAPTLKRPANTSMEIVCVRCGEHVTTVRSVQDFILGHMGHMGYLDGTR